MRATHHGEAYGTQELHPSHNPPRPASNPPRQTPADDPQWDKKNMSRSKTSRSHVADGDGCIRGYIDESAREAALLCICTRTYRSAHLIPTPIYRNKEQVACFDWHRRTYFCVPPFVLLRVLVFFARVVRLDISSADDAYLPRRCPFMLSDAPISTHNAKWGGK